MGFKNIIRTTLLAFLLAGFTEVMGQASFGSTESIVNTTTTNNQIRPAIAMNASGEYVVVWASEDQDGSDYGIYFQYYDSSGTASGSETLVHSGSGDSDGAQTAPSVDLDDTGAFSIAWMSDGVDGDGQGVYYKRYTNATTPLISEIRVNQTAAGDQKHPAVAGDSAGAYVIVFEAENLDGDGFGIGMRRFDNGSTLTSNIQVNDSTTGNQILPQIAMSPSGEFAVVWQGENTDGSGAGVFAKLYDNSGNVVKSEFQVNTTTAGNQQEPDVAMAADGSFTVVWTSYDQDGSDYGIYGQRYNASGVAQGSEFQINTTTAGTQNHPAITSTTEGVFVVLWDSYGQDGNLDGVYYQVYQNGGNTFGDESRVNIRTNDFQQFPAAAWHAESLGLKVAWQSGLKNSTSTQDASNYGIVMNSAVVSDTTPPTAVCQNITSYLDGSGNVTITATDVDNGSSDNTGIQTYSINTSTFACADLGVNLVTLTVTDSAGLTATCNAAVTVEDTVSPTAVCGDLTVFLDGSGNASITAGDVDNGSSDNCTLSSTSVAATSFTCSEVGVQVVTLTAQDQSGNTGTCTANVTVNDSIPPTALCGDLTVYLDGAGSATITTGDVDNGSSDNCSSLTYALSVSSFGCTETGANSTTLTVTDPGGNVDSCSATITVLDSVAPTMVCTDISVYLDGTGNATLAAADIDGGSSDNCSNLTLSIPATAFTCANIGTNAVVLTGTDGSGNTGTCTGNVTVLDSVSPAALCQNLTVYLNGAGTASITTGDIDNGSSDNCSLGTLSLDNSSFACANIGSNNVVLTVPDASGNVATCTSVVTVEDSISPTATCQDLTIHLSSSGSGSITTGDVDNGSTDNCSIASSSLDMSSFTCTNVGANTVTLTVTDAGGNTGTCTANIQVIDSVTPIATCQDVTLQLDGGGAAVLTTTAVDNNSTDACGINSLTLSTTSFTCADTGTSVVTLTVADLNGNSATCTSNITIEDVTAPNMFCQDITVQLNSGGTVSITTTDVNNGSGDNCGISSLSLDITSFGCTETGANTVTLSGSDVSANTANCTATVTVEDNIAPTALCQDLTLHLDGSGNASTSGTAVSNGSTDNCTILSETLNTTAFTCSDVGSNAVTLTVTDVSNNSTTCSANIEIIDSISPAAVCQNVTVQLDGGGNGTLGAGSVSNGSSDNCSINSETLSTTAYTCNDVGSTTVTLTVQDVNGNASTCVAGVTIEDVLAPVMVCQDLTVQLDANGDGSITTTNVDGGTSDNCQLNSTSINDSVFTCSDVGTNPVVLTADDVNGNTANCTATITVEDNVDPVSQCQNLFVFLDANGTGSIVPSAIDNGSTDACGIANLALDNDSFTCSALGNNTVTLTVTDVNGNTDNCTGNVTVFDTIAPGAICANISVYLDVNGTASLSGADIDGGSTDNCTITSLTSDISSFTCLDVGLNNATLTASDVSGNSNSCVASVNVLDTMAPVPTCFDVTVQLNSSGNITISTANVSSGSVDNCVVISEVLDKTVFTCADVGANTVTLTATDPNGNSGACTSEVTIVELIAPTTVCQNLNVFLDSNGAASISTTDVDNGSFDNCGITSLSLNQTTFACGDVGNQTVTMTAVDGSGNIGNCTSIVTVADTIFPTAVCQDLTLALDGTGNTAFTVADVGGASFDNCGIINAVLSATSFDCNNVGNNAVSLTQSDPSGNTVVCNVNIRVEDTTQPAMVCNDVTVSLNASGTGSITTATIDGGSVDNCGIASLIASQTSFDCADIGVAPVSLDAIDVNGNASSCVSQVTVVDQVQPNAVCQNLTVFLNGAATVTIAPSDVDGGSTDNCSIGSISLSQSTFNCSNLGANNVGLVISDSSGNSNTCAATIQVEDTIRPAAICQTVTVHLDANGQGSLLASQVDGGSLDNCTVDTIFISTSAFDCGDIGNNTSILTVQDQSGNTSTCPATIMVLDTTSPAVLCQSITVALDSSGSASIVASDLDAGTTDNCAVDSLNASLVTFACSDLGNVAVTLTAFDSSGNSSNCVTNVVVIDSIVPVANCIPSITLGLDGTGNATLNFPTINNGSFDNCGLNTGSLSQTSFSCSDLGVQNLELIVTDAAGNADTCQFVATVIDSLPPFAICQNLTLALDAQGLVVLSTSDINNGSSDNCSISNPTLSVDTFGCGDVGVNTTVLTVLDPSGNVDSCTASVTIFDNIAPNAICESITVYLDPTGNLTVTENDVAPNSIDNCNLTFNLTNNVFDCSDLGGNTVIVTAVDPSGNSNTCFAQVAVEDSTAPVVNCQDITIFVVPGSTVNITIPDVTTAPPTDNCGVGGASLDVSAFDCSNTGVNPVTVTVPDLNGNVGTCIAQVTVVDSIAPIASCQDITVSLDANGQAPVDPTLVDAGSIDNCGVDSLAMGRDTLTCADVGQQTETLFVFDLFGNVDSCTALVTVTDTLLPIAVCVPDTVGVDTGQVVVVPASNIDGGSSDNCGIASLSMTPDTFTIANLGLNNVVLTVTDNNGNVSTCNTTIFMEQMVGIEDGIDLQASLQFSAYPNPTQGILQVEVGCIDCIFREDARLTLVDLRGKVLVDRALKKNRANHTLEIDMSDYALGTYLLRLETERGEAVQHIVKY